MQRRIAPEISELGDELFGIGLSAHWATMRVDALP